MRRFAALVFGIFIALVLAEAVLQAGALVVSWRGRKTEIRPHGDRVRIVAVGDSNTFGLKLDAKDSYPSQLQRLLDARGDLPKVEVVNLGVPGTNASKLRARLPQILDDLSPDLLLMMIGGNDSWTAEYPLETSNLSQTLWQYSRVYRALYILRRAWMNRGATSAKASVEFDPFQGHGSVRVGGETIDLSVTAQVIPPSDWRRRMRGHLESILALTKQRGVATVLLTYPSDQSTYHAVNLDIRSVATRSGAPLVDVAAAVRPRCATVECPEYFFLPDYHATAAGNAIVSQAVLDGIVPMLGSRAPDGSSDQLR